MSATTSARCATHTRIRGLDGLRAIAAFLVLAYHLLPGMARGGFVGVDVFFVLSGFLITALLLREWDTRQSINLMRFWKRRVRRLLPAIVVVTLGATALARVFGGDALVQLRWQTVSALSGTYNWLGIVNQSSYFESQSPKLMTNMWSLAVEQQFYLVWPILLIVIVALVRNRIIRASLALILAGLSIGLNLLVDPAEATRAYIGTDTHAFGLMMGASLALILPNALTGERKPASRWWGYAAWVALGTLIAGALFLPSAPWFQPWGMVAASALSVVIIRGMLPDVMGRAGARLAHLLETRPMVWLGERSYGMYLWHWPLWVISFYHAPFDAWTQAAWVLLATIPLAHISYTYVETPIRRLGLKGWLGSLRLHAPRVLRTAGATVGAGLVALSTAGLASATPMASAEQILHDIQNTTPSSGNGTTYETEAEDPEPHDTTETDVASAAAVATGSESQSSAAPVETTEQPSQAPVAVAASSGEIHAPSVVAAQAAMAVDVPITGDQVTLIGDSVALAALPALSSTLPGIVVDAAVSRDSRSFAEVATALEQSGQLRQYVVVALATNGNIPTSIADEMMSIIGPSRRVVFVTGYAPQYATWVPEANAQIQAMAAADPARIRIADWGSIAAANLDLLAGDHVHPGSQAAQLFADEVGRALNAF